MKDKTILLNQAWVVSDRGKVVDILNTRKTFDQVSEYALDLYRHSHLSLEEKIPLAHYTKGKKNIRELFKVPVPVFTHYMSDLYRDLGRCISEQGLNDAECKELREKWGRYPEYITVGHTSDVSNEKWWIRLLKVAYILLYIPLLIIVVLIWFANSTSYDYYAGQYQSVNTYGMAFWYSLLWLLIGLVVIRLIKIAVLYIAMGQKPLWRREFKRWY